MSTQRIESNIKAVTVRTLHDMKQRHDKIVCLTAYDASFAALLDEVEIDVVLVGDSLGMVVQGESSTLPVTVDHIIYHGRAVARACKRALVMQDMPFMSYATPDQALHSAARLMQEGGAHMVKLEGTANQENIVRRLSDCGIPVCAHLGLRPQFVHKLGGYRVQGREQDGAAALLRDATHLEQAGADVLLLECVPSILAQEITANVRIPVIGIGAGNGCDGQVLVLYDMLGITPGKRPRFSKDFLAGGNTVRGAIESFRRDVKNGAFPSAEHSFQ